MSSSQVILNALPSFWRDRFEDRDLLENMYSYLGTYLGDVYEDANSQLSKLSLAGTPIYSYKTWSILPLSTIHRLSITPEGEEGTSIVIYGLREEDYILNSCYRLYSSPDLESSYIDTGDFSFYDLESKEISDLIELTANTAFFNRFSRFIVFTNLDPIYRLESQEPQEVRAFYPLAFRVNNYLLEGLTEAEIIASRVTITAADETVVTNILSVEKQTETTLLLVDPGAFTPFIDDSTVNIAGITANTIPASVYTSYGLLATNINLWAYDCEIDHLELFRRWGFLLRPDFTQRRPIRSSELYKNLLEEMLEARLRGLSSSRLENIASLLSGSDRIVFSNLNDTILTIDLVDNLVISELTTYTLRARQTINLDIAKAASTFKTLKGVYSRSSCLAIEILDEVVFRLLVSTYNTFGPHRVVVRLITGELVGEVLVTCTDDTIIVTYENSVPGIGNIGLHIYYTENEFINLSASKYSVIDISEQSKLSSGEIVNPEATALDISNGLLGIDTQAIFLPSNIWEVGEPSRRELTNRLTPHILGQMPNHRVGDYELFIPVEGNTTQTFDRITSLNPNGYAWPTSYKLYTDFLTTKLAILRPLNYPSNLDSCVELVKSIKDASKRILIANDVPIVDFIPYPQDHIEVVVTTDNISDDLVTQSYGGVGALGVTLLLSGDINITSSDTVNRIGLLPPPSGGFQFVQHIFFDVTLIGYDSGYALVDAGYSAEQLITLLESGYTIDLIINARYKQVSLEIVTNYVGSDSILMTVGASYPEYTKYYNFDKNTLSEWVQIGVTPGAPPSELSEDPIQVSDNLEQPQILVPLIQSLEDNIESPSDNLPDPEEI